MLVADKRDGRSCHPGQLRERDRSHRPRLWPHLLL